MDQALSRDVRPKARTIQQQDAKNQHQGDDRHHQTRGPVHAAADPPEQRATHENGNDDIELQWARPCCRSAPAA